MQAIRFRVCKRQENKRTLLSSMIRVLALMFGFGWSAAHGGVDIGGPVQRVHLAADGNLWFVMETTPAATYCLTGWFDFNMYVPKDHP